MKILRSLFVTLTISGLFAFIFKNYWISVFILVTIIQVIGFSIGRTIYENYLKKELFKIQADREIEARKQFLMLECPCTEKVKQNVEISLQDGKYECLKCKKTINTSVEVKNLLATEPIYFNNRL